MPDGFIERTTTAVLRDAFRVETQVPNAPSPPLEADDNIPRIPYWLYGQKSRATAFSRDDLRKMSPDAPALINVRVSLSPSPHRLRANHFGRRRVAERWKPMTGKVYRIGDRLLRLLYVRRGEPVFEIEVHPLPLDSADIPRPERVRDEDGAGAD